MNDKYCKHCGKLASVNLRRLCDPCEKTASSGAIVEPQLAVARAEVDNKDQVKSVRVSSYVIKRVSHIH